MNTLNIELIVEKTCPNIEAARQQITRACNNLNIKPLWQEWEVSAADAPEHIHGYGSPTILINGKDVSGDMTAGDDFCCRVYNNEQNNNKGIPALNDIEQAITNANQIQATTPAPGSWKNTSAVLPAMGIAFLPKLACPACWPAYAGLLSSMGLGFIDYTPYLLPLTFLFLGIALLALLITSRRNNNYQPLALGIIASIILLTGKFYFDNDIAMYTGIAMLMIASLWNSWPASNPDTNCPACIKN